MHRDTSFCIAGTLIFQDHSVFTPTSLAILDAHHVIVVVKLVGLREFPVLCSVDWHVWFGVSEAEFVGKLILQHVSEDTSGQLAHHRRPFLSQFDHSQHVAPPLIGSAVCAKVNLFASDDVLANQILTGGAVDHNILI